jgi:uncharacterized protein (UPF0332 family)
MEWQAYLDKAQSNLRAAEVALASGEYDPCVSRAYYAVFHAEIAALIKMTDFRPPQWGHDRVQAEFNRRLIHAQKLFPGRLRFIHSDLIGRRRIADYEEKRTGKVTAERCVKKAKEMAAEIARALEEER